MKAPKDYINPYLGGALLGVVLFLSFVLTHNGLGASGAINRVQVGLLDIFASFHVDRVEYLAEMAGGGRNPWDAGSVVMLLGTLLGGAISGIFNGRFKLELRKGPNVSNTTRLVMAFIGGLIMAYGARLARGCTSGQALSGGATLAVGSWALMFCIFGSAYALAYFLRKYWN